MKFNAETVDRKGVTFSVLAGNPLPPVCRMLTRSDGVVAEPSAKWMIADNETQAVLHTSMAETGPFSTFVMPRIALGPGEQSASASKSAASAGSARARLMLLGVEGPKEENGSTTPDFSKILLIAPGQTLTVTIPVEEASNLGLTFLAANSVSATLIDDKGQVVASNRSDTPGANQIFRSSFVDRATTTGSWKLILESKDRADREIILSTWTNSIQ